MLTEATNIKKQTNSKHGKIQILSVCRERITFTLKNKKTRSSGHIGIKSYLNRVCSIYGHYKIFLLSRRVWVAFKTSILVVLFYQSTKKIHISSAAKNMIAFFIIVFEKLFFFLNKTLSGLFLLIINNILVRLKSTIQQNSYVSADLFALSSEMLQYCSFKPLPKEGDTNP